jgi:hypothetical protein
MEKWFTLFKPVSLSVTGIITPHLGTVRIK